MGLENLLEGIPTVEEEAGPPGHLGHQGARQCPRKNPYKTKAGHLGHPGHLKLQKSWLDVS
jgi:hypothetical protein